MAINVQARAFIVPKIGELYADIQDSFGELTRDVRYIGIADGISQSLFPRQWADLIVNGFNQGTFSLKDASTHELLSHQWRKKAVDIVAQKQECGDKNSWVFENQLASNRSAGATFVGLQLNDNLDSWSAEIIGDSCLVEVAERGIITKMYASKDLDSGSFDNFPDYLDSRHGKFIVGNPIFPKGTVQSGNKLMLVTDALADMLNEWRKENKDINELLNLKNHKDFVDYVEKYRVQGLLKNDDTTLVILDFLEDATCDKARLELQAQTDELAEQNQEQEVQAERENTSVQIEKSNSIDYLNAQSKTGQ